MRIAGASIPNNKRLVIALTYIYGIGLTLAKKICADLKIDESVRVNALSDAQIIDLRSFIEKTFEVEEVLRAKVQKDIRRKIAIKCYQGLRHRARLPVRGQNTHSNARTRKGKAVPIAGKKKVTK
ncbi:30S ribosomal protein S13 [Rickettsiales endosymbiont of Paramecium tredecaurelia]|uniref:30S ribosomal protein S13 n=1 Tax=Candidatus Sarmatiella mevalonica TaxID=2770581 RepID=UPI001920A3EC|nr:30S ribosomal protein S13 [Candidatus Sarmatiella mevalonica]MBL3284790.1 30S ribosomal protein S13 [Candidatus Sarmatiella mevalonica]